MMVRELRSPNGQVIPYRDVTPASLAADPYIDRRISVWLLREISVLLENDVNHRQPFVHDLVVDLLKRFNMDSEVGDLSFECYIAI